MVNFNMTDSEIAEQERKYPMALPMDYILADRYQIKKVLGRGGFGITYLALDFSQDIPVAIKEYMPETAAIRTPGNLELTIFSEEAEKQFEYGKGCFLNEAQVLEKFLGHSTIVDVLGYFEQNGTAYLVMEFVEGVSFKQYIAQQGGHVSWEDARAIMLPVMYALSDVHSQGILHRDVTPDNIYICPDGRVKLLDFGAARYSMGDRTMTLDVILKAGYAPMEQYTRLSKQGPYTDVYSAAACLYAAITGYLPPEAPYRFGNDEFVPVNKTGFIIPDFLDSAISKALAVNFTDRYQTMEQFIAAVNPSVEVSPTVVNITAAAAISFSDRLYYCELDTNEITTVGSSADCGLVIPAFPMKLELSCRGHDILVRILSSGSGAELSVSFNAITVLDTERMIAVYAIPKYSGDRKFIFGNISRVNIGRSYKADQEGQYNNIVLKIPYISSHHMSIRKKGFFWYVYDNNSSNGTYLNGRRISSARIKKGDIISVFTSRIIFNGDSLSFENIYDDQLEF